MGAATQLLQALVDFVVENGHYLLGTIWPESTHTPKETAAGKAHVGSQGLGSDYIKPGSNAAIRHNSQLITSV